MIKIAERIRGLAITPEIGTPLSATCAINTDYRFLVCGSYLVFYRYAEKTVYVVRVLYGKMNYLEVLFGDELGADPIDLYNR
ncbi:MAG: type II toxin-antitoxin system RelE/ParE family toxin [Coriobacteriales bacterium]|jgi:plasmid stabilization system protein ParE|nr:type II toxin-antitoxin system RelE/ParE family toxin [Coriobacteriales bacterium]